MIRKGMRKGILCLALMAILAVALVGTSAESATINVTTNAPDELGTNSSCSLREAITNINNGADTYADCAATGTYGTADTINLPAGTYTNAIAGAAEDLNASGDLDILASVTITGAGAASTIIDGGGPGIGDRVVHIVTGSITVSIIGVTVQNGYATGSAPAKYGGGIYNNAANLTVTNSILSTNSSVTYGAGGGIYNLAGSLSIDNSTITGNTATRGTFAGGNGGGIYNTGGTVTVTNSTISNNEAGGGQNGGGGGVWNDGTVTITGTTVSSNNSPPNSGGGGGGRSGIWNFGTLAVNDSTVSNNTNTGIVNEVGGTLTIKNSVVSGNYGTAYLGCGIINSGTADISNSTISGNSAGYHQGGGGILNTGNLTITNTTISTNNAGTWHGGGIGNSGTATIINSTITNNTGGYDGGGIWNGGSATASVTLKNTIVANQALKQDCTNASGTITALLNNLDSDGTCGAGITADPLLGLLQDNGGPTQTHALQAGSPAIDAGDPASTLTTDQRGFPRPVDGNSDSTAVIDIGAYEYEPCTPPPSGMVSWWGGDNNALDMAGTNDGTLMNGATYATGMVGQAFSFDGVDDYVSVPYASSLDFTGGDFSIDAWVYPTGIGSYGEGIAGRLASDNSSGWGLAIQGSMYGTAGKLNFMGNNSWVGQSADTILPNTWTHVAITRSGNSVTYYINGSPSGSFTFTGNLNNSLAMAIGDMYPSWPGSVWRFNGHIDEAEFFNRALSTSEIQKIYNAGPEGKCRPCTPPPSGMVSWWMAENNPNDSVGTNDGTLMNGATYATGMVGQAFSFDGADDYIDAGNNINLANQSFSFSLWAKRATTNAEIILGQGIAAVHQGLHVGFRTANTFTFDFYSGTLDVTDATFSDSNWHHWAGTYNASTQVRKLYRDGALIGNDVIAHYQGTGAFLIGKTTAAAGFSTFGGLLDEVQVYNSALTADEIAAIYNARSSGICAPDSTPDPFSFTDQTGVNISTIIQSDTITVSGINVRTDISITSCTGTNCEYRINSGSWTSTAGKVNNGDTIQVRQTSSGSYSTQTDLVLDIGGVTDTFSVTTILSHTLKITKTGSGTGKVTSSPAGIDCGSTCSDQFGEGEVVALTPTPDISSTFAGWSGDSDCSDGQVTMSTDVNCTATFDLKSYTITATAGTGGSINPPGNVVVTYGSDQNFTITPDTCYHIVDVSADGISKGAITNYSFTNVMDSHTISASFAIDTYTITATAGTGGSILPSGGIVVNCGNDQSFTITPSTGYHILNVLVDGVSKGAITNYTFTNVKGTHTISATFGINTYTLRTQKTGTGNGTVTSNPAGINCGSDCTDIYNYGTIVTLTPTPDTGSTFTGWSGNADCSDGQVTMDSNKSCIATFTLNQYTVTANAQGNGTGMVQSNVGGINYSYPSNNTGTTTSLDHGSSITITANAGTGTTASWKGTCTATGGTEAGNDTNTATCTFSSLDGNKTITVTFSKRIMATADMNGNGKDELIIDFPGHSIWVRKDNREWAKLSDFESEEITKWVMDSNDRDDIIVDFGSKGIWVRANNSTWSQFNPVNPDQIVTGNIDGKGKDDVIVDFGPGYGIWARMNNVWWVKFMILALNLW